jgi:riboflavin kinase/FMN adenylyltransferase
LRSSVVTIGKFDGIHLGHQKLIAETVLQQKAKGLSSVLVTFDKHPDAVLNPERLKLPLIGPQQKIDFIESLGIENLLVLPFTAELAAQTGEAFVDEVLCQVLSAKSVVVGPDFRFGNRGACGVAELQAMGHKKGFAVSTIDPIEFQGTKVSTSAIREALDSGSIVRANSMFGRVHTTVGMVEHGLKIGRSIGFPTANISRDAEGYLPTDGVYAGWLIADGVRYPAAHSVGVNETFQAVPRLVESHVIGTHDLDLYDKVATLEYIDFIRPAAKFSGVEDLVAEINRDIAKVKAILGV